MDFLGLYAQLCQIYPSSEAENICAWVASDLFAIPNFRHAQLSPAQTDRLAPLAARLLAYEPVQYVIGTADFYGMRLKVDKNVLIPRPETEELVYNIAQKHKKTAPVPLRCLEVGTGSGCIGLGLKKLLPHWQICSVDISPEALAIAEHNSQEQRLRLDLKLVDFRNREEWQPLGKFDILVSNPPYILSSERPQMSQNTLLYEPKKALFVDNENAGQFYQLFADWAADFLAPQGQIWAELSEFTAQEVLDIYTQNADFQHAELIKDLSGKWRILHAVKKPL